VETVEPGATNVHGWAFPNRLEALEDFDLVDTVGVVTFLGPVHLRHTSSQNFPRPRDTGLRFTARPWGCCGHHPAGLHSGRVAAQAVRRDYSNRERAARSGEVFRCLADQRVFCVGLCYFELATPRCLIGANRQMARTRNCRPVDSPGGGRSYAQIRIGIMTQLYRSSPAARKIAGLNGSVR
jgi:hypothetical protein